MIFFFLERERENGRDFNFIILLLGDTLTPPPPASNSFLFCFVLSFVMERFECFSGFPEWFLCVSSGWGRTWKRRRGGRGEKEREAEDKRGYFTLLSSHYRLSSLIVGGFRLSPSLFLSLFLSLQTLCFSVSLSPVGNKEHLGVRCVVGAAAAEAAAAEARKSRAEE